MKRQSGFTLIELVMVIVILGILSAFALPRFADLGQEARIASLNGLVGALNSATAIARAEQLVSGVTADTDVVLEGQTIAMTAGAPSPTLAGIVEAAQVNTNDYDITVAGTTVTFTIPNIATCSVTYDGAVAADATATPPVAAAAAEAQVADTSGC